MRTLGHRRVPSVHSTARRERVRAPGKLPVQPARRESNGEPAVSDGRRVVVLGRGFVGRAVDRRLRADPGHEVVVLEPADDAELAGRTPAGAERLRAAIGSASQPVMETTTGSGHGKASASTTCMLKSGAGNPFG